MAQGKRARASDDLKDIGRRVRWAREIVSKSQADMCRLLDGVDTSTWNRWEKGNRYPNPAVLVRSCDMFGLTMDYFYRGKLGGVREDVAFRLATHRSL